MARVDEEPNAGKLWTDAELALLRRLADERVPTGKIAERLGRSEYSVRTKARLARIPLQSGSERRHRPRHPR